MKFPALLTPKEEDLKLIRSLNVKAPHIMAATWFGAGFMRPAPGTWGSLAALPFGLLFLSLGGQAAVYTLITAVILVTALGLWAARKFEEDSGVHDCKMVVIDEVAGQWLALIPIAQFSTMTQPLFPLYILLAFVLFRFFDILKPWPVSFFDQKVKGALGVMGDDIVAGLYAAMILMGIIVYAGSS